MNIWLDVTTILSWGRPALGIVRVEAETLRYFLAVNDERVRFCRFDREAGNYGEVSRDIAIDALACLDAGGQKSPLSTGKVLAQPFHVGDTYISLGLDWDQKDLPFLYTLKKALGLKVLLFCYDIIPILMPEHCVSGVSEKFQEYFVNVAWCADSVLSISECSRNDLRDYLESVGAPIPELGVVRLGGDLPTAIALPPSPEIAELIKKEFILFVSTIEARKNHKILYQAYKKILESGNTNIPLLLFVGMQGWGVDDLIASIQENREIRPYIHRLNHVSDSDLVHLYKNCLFTVYPSLYEGWGLPVAESLAYGKFCIASDAASIPEVGGNLIEYISPQNKGLWAERLNWYFQNRETINERQNVIVRNYRSSTWKETGAAIFNAALNL
ncbi:MAG: glycosyltransferase family 4 protein [Betaproteobacteria bacterium]|nr:glycosyltransferase family 4 protein [Betaproteobacteria bacterium]